MSFSLRMRSRSSWPSARRLVLARKEIKRIEIETVAHVEGEASLRITECGIAATAMRRSSFM
jgi:hypothetical protein